MAPIAVGSQALFGIGRESAPGVPAGSLLYWLPVLPLAPYLVRSESAGNEVNASGFPEPGVPGAITGPLDVGVRFSAGHLLEILEALSFSLEKTTLDTGIYQYDATPDREFLQTLWGYWSAPPVDRGYLYHMLLSELDLAIPSNAPMVARCKGEIGHGTRFSPGVQVSGTGTYALTPRLRGQLFDPTAGRKVSIKITSVSPLAFKVSQHSGSPSFSGSAVTALMVDSSGAWQNVQGADGLDLGFWAENRDPLEDIFPGTASDYADLAVNDIFEFDLDFDEPSPTYLDAQRFTSAHALLRTREVGDSTWITTGEFISGGSKTAWPVARRPRNFSRYPGSLDRQGELTHTQTLVRYLDSLDYTLRLEAHKRMEAQVEFMGRQLGDGAYRESVRMELLYASVKSLTKPISNQNAIQETVTLMAEKSPDGDVPVTFRIITDRNFTPSAGL